MDELKARIVDRLRGSIGAPLAIGRGDVVDVIDVAVQPWTGARFDSNRLDCNKKTALLADADGKMSCLEVEVVRTLRDMDGWAAGWVQAWRCGGDTWAQWIWSSLPPPLASRNQRVQAALDRGPAKLGGHPDIGLVAGDRVLYLECKIANDKVDKQLGWFAAGIDSGAISNEDLLIVQGVS